MLLGGKPLGSELLRMAVLVAATSKLCIPGTWQARSGGVELDEQVAKHLSTAYGDLASDVVALSVGERLCVRLDKRHPVLEGEVVWAVRYEMCRTAADFLARRCRLAFLDVQAAQQVRALNQTDLAHACCGCSACDALPRCLSFHVGGSKGGGPARAGAGLEQSAATTRAQRNFCIPQYLRNDGVTLSDSC